MRQGLTFDGLISEVSRQANARRDFKAPARLVAMDPELRLTVKGERFAPTDIAHRQLAEFTGIPGAFYSRLQAADPELLAYNVNRLNAARGDEKRLIRTIDGQASAFLSDRYRCIDHYGLIEQLLPTLAERKDLRFASADLTESRLYLKVVSDELVGEVKRGDVVRMGLVISNSEVGLGSVLVAPFSEVLSCTNGATHTNLGTRRAHIGRNGDDSDEAAELFTDETKAADDRAFFLKVRDVISATLRPEMLGRLLDAMRESAGERIEGDPAAVVEIVAERHQFNEAERTATLRHLIEGADLSRWGLANAITRAAQDAASYDRASELETLGGGMMLTPGIPAREASTRKRRGSGRRSSAEIAASN